MTHITDIRSKTSDELKEMALSLKKELFNLRFRAASGEEVPVARFRAARRDVARIQTVINDPQQQLSAAGKKSEKKATEPKAKKAPAKKKAAGE